MCIQLCICWHGGAVRVGGVHFADAVAVLEDDQAITIRDYNADEERFKTLGTDVLGRILVVATHFVKSERA